MMNETMLKNLRERTAPEGLAEKIFLRIARREVRIARIRFALFMSVLAASVALFIPVVTMLWNDLVSSGSTNFFSMLFTNFSDVMASWKDFILSFFENLPVFSVAVFLFIIFAILLSLHFVQRDVRRVFYKTHSLKI